MGEPDALSTRAQLLAEKRVGFLLLTVGLVLYLSGLVWKSPEGMALMGTIAGGVVIAGLVRAAASSSPGWLATGFASRRATGPWSIKILTRCRSSSHT